MKACIVYACIISVLSCHLTLCTIFAQRRRIACHAPAFRALSPIYGPGWEAAAIHRSLTEGARRVESTDFLVLAIETSCDDTATAVLSSDGKLLGESIQSQGALNQMFGGVNPAAAKAAHEMALPSAIDTALLQAGVSLERDVDVIAATTGPGLQVCLSVGLRAAQMLCRRLAKPFMAINHLEAHCLSPRLPVINPGKQLVFPYLAVLVSGGHTLLAVVHGVANYTILGETLDDAIGEALDKAARLLGLPLGVGGGRQLELLAGKGDPFAYHLPKPMQRVRNMHLSFAGLKSAFSRIVRRATMPEPRFLGDSLIGELDESVLPNFAAAFQNAAFSHLEGRLARAMDVSQDSWGIDTMAIVGGVAANVELQRRLQALCVSRSQKLEREDRKGLSRSWRVIIPPRQFCGDNAAMIAWAAIEKLKNRPKGISDVFEGADVLAKWPLGHE